MRSIKYIGLLIFVEFIYNHVCWWSAFFYLLTSSFEYSFCLVFEVYDSYKSLFLKREILYFFFLLPELLQTIVKIQSFNLGWIMLVIFYYLIVNLHLPHFLLVFFNEVGICWLIQHSFLNCYQISVIVPPLYFISASIHVCLIDRLKNIMRRYIRFIWIE